MSGTFFLDSSKSFHCSDDGEMMIIITVVFVDSASDIKSIYAQPLRESGSERLLLCKQDHCLKTK